MKRWIQLNLLVLVAVMGIFVINSPANAKTGKNILRQGTQSFTQSVDIELWPE